jgi:hypothetical protein
MQSENQKKNKPQTMQNIPETVRIIRTRIDACDTLIDYVLDDIPHARQQPLLEELRQLRSGFDSDLLSLKQEMEAA